MCLIVCKILKKMWVLTKTKRYGELKKNEFRKFVFFSPSNIFLMLFCLVKNLILRYFQLLFILNYIRNMYISYKSQEKCRDLSKCK